MKRTCKALSILLALCLLLPLVPAARAEELSGTCGANLKWSLSEDGAMTISGTGDMDDYGFDISTVSFNDTPWERHKREIKSITVESGCTRIGNEAFSSCGYAESVSLPNTLETIGESAFRYCSGLESIVIPDSVTEIDHYAFQGCRKLESLKLSKNLKTMKWSVFADCVALTAVTIPGSLKTVSIRAFSGCKNLENLTISEGVDFLASEAFENCVKLSSVTLPASMTEVYSRAFSGCIALNEFKVASRSESFFAQDGVLFSKNMETLVMYPTGKTDDSYVIPDGVKALGNYAFFGARLKTVSIPKTVRLGNGIFQNCAALTDVILPNDMKEIGQSMFGGCSSLKSFTFPESIEKIGKYAFNGCTALESMVIPGKIETIEEGAFGGCYSLRYVVIQDGTTSIGPQAFLRCRELSWIAIPSSVQSIGYCAFDTCTALADIYYAGDETAWAEIKKSYYGSDDSLEKATVHYGHTFGACGDNLLYHLTDSGVLYIIGEGEMKSRPWLTEENKPLITAVDIAPGVTSIYKGAFNGCSNLKYIIIPNTVKEVGMAATNGCNGLTDVYYGGDSWTAIYNALPGGNSPLKDAKFHCNTTCPWTEINAAVWGQMIDYCTVQNVPKGAVLIAARYDDDGRMTRVWTKKFDADTDYCKMESILTEGEGNTFKL
ncbi:MAG: leucine-rich repeat domain-containing protein, partial [Oscillospiraceae bacterium]|nr:leucine-rich repeat domain-containing protein [Oscillospiraceae bacterium]